MVPLIPSSLVLQCLFHLLSHTREPTPSDCSLAVNAEEQMWGASQELRNKFNWEFILQNLCTKTILIICGNKSRIFGWICNWRACVYSELQPRKPGYNLRQFDLESHHCHLVVGAYSTNCILNGRLWEQKGGVISECKILMVKKDRNWQYLLSTIYARKWWNFLLLEQCTLKQGNHQISSLQPWWTESWNQKSACSASIKLSLITKV